MMQCQREVGRFASGEAQVDEIRKTTNKAVIRLLILGDRAGALQAMYDGLARQAPLSFKPPVVTP